MHLLCAPLHKSILYRLTASLNTTTAKPSHQHTSPQFPSHKQRKRLRSDRSPRRKKSPRLLAKLPLPILDNDRIRGSIPRSRWLRPVGAELALQICRLAVRTAQLDELSGHLVRDLIQRSACVRRRAQGLTRDRILTGRLTLSLPLSIDLIGRGT